MVRDSNTLWLSSGNLNNSNQPEMDPIGSPKPTDQATAKKSDRDWHVIVESPDLARIFEAYLDADLAQATLHAATAPVAANKKLAAKKQKPVPKMAGVAAAVSGDFTFVAPKTIQEQVTITPLLTPDIGDYQGAMLALINSVRPSCMSNCSTFIHRLPQPRRNSPNCSMPWRRRSTQARTCASS